MKTNVYKRFDPRMMEREERIGINRGLPTMLKMGHSIVLKEIQHLTGMTHCASFSGMEQFGSGIRELGEQSTVSLRRLFLKFSCHKLKI